MNNNYIFTTTKDLEKAILQSIYIAERISAGEYESDEPQVLLDLLEALKTRIDNLSSMSSTRSPM